MRFHAAVRHPAINPVLHVVPFGIGPVLVMPWLDADLLRGPGGWSRFRALPVPSVEAAVESLLSAHRAVVAAGFVEVDLYAGSLMYDFDRQALTLIDLDDYRPGPFTTGADRLPGSTALHGPGAVGRRHHDRRADDGLRARPGDPADARRARRRERLAGHRRRSCPSCTGRRLPSRTDRYATVAALHDAWALSPSTPR